MGCGLAEGGRLTLEDLARLVGLLPWVPTVVFVVGGAWAILLLTRPPRNTRPDRRSAVGCVVALSLLLGGAVLAFAAALGNAWGGNAGAGIPTGLPIAIGIGAMVFLAGLTGYALLARPSVGDVAIIGVVVGPLLLGGTTWLAVPTARDMQRSLEQRAIEERSQFIHVTVEDIRYTTGMTRDPATGLDVEVVTSVNLTIDIRIDSARDLLAFGVVNLYPSGRIEDALVYQSYLRSETLRAGTSNRFPLSFGLDPPALDARQRLGQWTLGLILHFGNEGTEYRTEQTITVGPG